MGQTASYEMVTPTVWKLAASGTAAGTVVDIDNQIDVVARIVKIELYYKVAICGLVVHYRRFDGRETSYTLGARDGQLQQINFRPTEYIRSIRGWVGTEMFIRALASIEFETNLTKYGPYTHWSRFVNVDAYIFGKWYDFTLPASRIIGFHGRIVSLPTGYFIGALGVYVKALLKYDIVQINVCPAIWKYGPCGGRGGKERNMDRLSDVSRIVRVSICQADDIINGLIVYYKKHVDGSESTYRLGSTVGKLTEMAFAPTEYITRVRGCVGYLNEKEVVRSIEFITNRASGPSNYGPYGLELPDYTEFDFDAKDSEIIGFHGRSGSTYNNVALAAIGLDAIGLDAIGVYVKIVSQGQGSSDGTRN